jgi:hypothetical protein
MVLRATLLVLLAVAPAMAAEPPASGRCIVPDGVAGSRPGADGGPTEVSLGLYVIDVGSIDDVAQGFNADFYVRARWDDPRLGGVPSGCRISLNQVWTPAILVVNQRELRREFEETVTVGPDGRLTYIQRFSGDLAAPLDLRRFPRDSQRLPVRLVSLGHDPQEVSFTIDEQATGQSDEFSIPVASATRGFSRPPEKM